MKTLRGENTILITGWFKKRYWYIIPGQGVYELPVTTVKDVMKGIEKNASAK